jgi:hypothetical protein
MVNYPRPKGCELATAYLSESLVLVICCLISLADSAMGTAGTSVALIAV